MLSSYCVRIAWRKESSRSALCWRRNVHINTYDRLSRIWTPAQIVKTSSVKSDQDGHDLLVQAGFLRQAQSGIFHLLPLGLRVLTRLETLIDEHMTSIGASKVSLSSLSSQGLWQKSGRLDGRNAEFFKLEDRKGAAFLLAPTHEEEITSIVANAVSSYKDLPLRLYQVTRKYRDEARPRQGLLRGREFVMKDLYTFDVDDASARLTYEEVRTAYRAFLTDLGLPFLVASADSGNMGGSLSHEYHFVSSRGEDTIIACDTCDHALNEELYTGDNISPSSPSLDTHQTWTGISKDRQTLHHIHYPTDATLNIYAAKSALPNLDTTISTPTATQLASTTKTQHLHDPRLNPSTLPPSTPSDRTLTTPLPDSPCPSCATGKIQLHRAVEIGHTFHLGTRYSAPLRAQVLSSENQRLDIAMGCHGIGVTRLIGAIAALLADGKGLNWPVGVAPWDVVVVDGSVDGLEERREERVERLVGELEGLGLSVVVDERRKMLIPKLREADLIGYPLIVVLGKAWREGRLEVQCRQLGVKEEVEVSGLKERISELKGMLKEKLMMGK